MNLKYTKLGTGNKKILFDDNMLNLYSPEFQEINKNNHYSFFFLERKQFQSLFKHNIINHISFDKLEKTYKNSKELNEYYLTLINFIKRNKITHVIIMHTGQYWHPEFIKQLKKDGITMCIWTADDDSNTIKYCSLPYTKYYDYHFHAGVMFDHTKTIAEILKEHGSKNPIWVPLGAMKIHTNDNINFKNRDIEICYIGNINPLKLFRISKLKRHFGKRFKLYGAQGNGDRKSLKGIFYKLANKIFCVGYVKKVTDDELKEIYARTKIGFNMHLFDYKGPSNMRLYELPINGVMQICDNEKGLSKIFQIGKEVIGYKNINEAIKKIEYYLKNEEERIKIAEGGYKRCIKEYTYKESLSKVLGLIFKN